MWKNLKIVFESVAYQCTVLPCGLSLGEMGLFLGEMGILIMNYLDDWFV